MREGFQQLIIEKMDFLASILMKVCQETLQPMLVYVLNVIHMLIFLLSITLLVIHKRVN